MEPSAVLPVITWLYVALVDRPGVHRHRLLLQQGPQPVQLAGLLDAMVVHGHRLGRQGRRLLLAVRNSLVLGVVTIVIVVPLGVALAVGLNRWRNRLATAPTSSRSSHWSRPRS